MGKIADRIIGRKREALGFAQEICQGKTSPGELYPYDYPFLRGVIEAMAQCGAVTSRQAAELQDMVDAAVVEGVPPGDVAADLKKLGWVHVEVDASGNSRMIE